MSPKRTIFILVRIHIIPMTILYIDDDPDDRETFKEALWALDLSYKYIEATGGKSALQILNSVVPGCIFLDVNMPEMNGREVLLKIRSLKKLHHVPVVMFSTQMTRDDIVEFKSKGAAHGIAKPVRFNDLCATLRSVIQELAVKP